MRNALGTAFLAFQLGAIVYARFVPARYFCWAPYDTQTDYAIEATLQGRRLAAGEIRSRYRRGARGVDNRSPQHVIDILEQVEKQRPAAEQAEVRLRYRVNGKEEHIWQWTPR